MNKGVANLPSYQRVARTANERYLEALSVVNDPAPAYQQMSHLTKSKVTKSKKGKKRTYAGFNPARADHAQLFRAVLSARPLAAGILQRSDPPSLVGPTPQRRSTPPTGPQSDAVVEASAPPRPAGQNSSHPPLARHNARTTGARHVGPTALPWTGHCDLVKMCAHVRIVRSETLGDLLDYARKSRPPVRHLVASTRTGSFYSREREAAVRLVVVGPRSPSGVAFPRARV